jgi:Cu/Ag efflux pump CusA
LAGIDVTPTSDCGLALAAIVLVAGPQIIRNMPLDVFPEFAPPLVEVQTEGPGLSATEVESLVTVPIENVLNGTPSLDTLRSRSVLGLSSVVLIFEQGTDLMRARQFVQERLAILAGQLPAVAQQPVILQPLSSTSRMMKIGISSKTLNQMEMTTLARWTIRPRLMAVPGVANVAIWGQRDRQLQVLVDPERLYQHQVKLNDVIASTSEAVTIGAGGFMDTPNQRLAITHPAPLLTAKDLEQVTLDYRDGTPLRLRDVAQVVEGFPPPIGDAIINDAPGLLLIVEKQRDANTLEVTRNVESALEALRPGLTGLDIDPTIFRPATFIEMSLANLNRALLIGSILVIVVLVLFLFDWRTALISVLAIPLSLMTAVLVLYYRGVSINTMVLAGLVIALGEVVDDAIIDVENILRRLRLNRAAGNPDSAFKVVLKASLEVRSAIVYATMIVVLVFLPIFFLPGLSGSFFRPLAVSYILAVVASLLVAVTLTPALSLVLLPHVGQQTEAPVTRWLKGGYRRILPGFIHRPKLAVGVLSVMLLATAISMPFLGEEFLPNFREYDFLMHWLGKPGTSLEAMNRTTLQASRELRAIPGVRNFGSHAGRAEVADEVVGPDFVEFWISLDPSVDYDATVARLQEVVAGYPGLFHDVLTYLKERIKEVLTGASATVVVRIYGPDLDVLRAKAEEAGKVMSSIEGIRDLKVEQQVLIPRVETQYRHDTAAQFGLRPGDVRRQAARNGIMLVSHWRHLEEVEGLTFGRDLVMQGAEERLAPILMTALATGLALLPIVLGGNRPGHEIEHPLAVVIMGGLVTSTALNILLMPSLYLRFGRRSAVKN